MVFVVAARSGCLRASPFTPINTVTVVRLYVPFPDTSRGAKIFLTERYEEGLMVLRRILGWDMIDMTYLPMKVTEAGEKRWDGKRLANKPSFDELPKKVRH